MRQRATRMGGNRAPAALAARVAALMASFSGPKVWFDPSDISTMSQDTAGATPVATAGDPIGRIMDKSGAANHATQSTTTSRPLWQTSYAAFDGMDDSWATPNIDFTSTDKVTVVAGVRKLSDAAVGAVFELSAVPVSNNGSFGMLAPGNVAPNLQFVARGTVTTSATNNSAASPFSAVMTGLGDTSAVLTLRTNGSAVVGPTTPGGGNYGTYPLYVGRRGGTSFAFNGNLYGLIIIGRLLSPDELWVCERYMAQQVGITI